MRTERQNQLLTDALRNDINNFSEKLKFLDEIDFNDIKEFDENLLKIKISELKQSFSENIDDFIELKRKL